MWPSKRVIDKMNKTNDMYCAFLAKNKVRVTRIFFDVKSNTTNYRANLVWDYPAVAVTSFDINGKYVHKNYSRAVKPHSYNAILTNKLNSLEKNKYIGMKRGNTLIGHCAEPHAANQTMNDYKKVNSKDMCLSDIYFSLAKRPRTMEVVPTCNNCKDTFPNLA